MTKPEWIADQFNPSQVWCLHFSTNLTSEKHNIILSEDGILEISTVIFLKQKLFAIGAIFGPKYGQTRAPSLFAKVQ